MCSEIEADLAPVMQTVNTHWMLELGVCCHTFGLTDFDIGQIKVHVVLAGL